MAAAKPDAHRRRQGISDADWDTVESHGGFNAVVRKIFQREQENPASNGREMIDALRLPGSRTWRRMGGHLSDGGWLTQVAHQVAHAFDHPNAPLSEGEVLAVVVQVVPGNPHWKRVGTDSPCPLRQSVVRRRRHLARCVVASHRRGSKWRERPRVFGRWCGTGRGEVVHAKNHHHPSPAGSLPPQ